MLGERNLMAIAAAAGCTFAVAACGSSSNPASTNATTSTMLVKYSECMRSHGASGFPDPSTHQGANSFGIDGYNFNLPDSMDTNSPVYEAAQKTCGPLISGGSGGHRPFDVAKARRAAIAHAACMRRHGVPNFPDPTVSGNSQGISVGSDSGGAGVNPRSPAFQRAQKSCQPGAP